MSFKKTIKRLFFPEHETKKMHEEIKAQRVKISALINDYSILQEWNSIYTDTINGLSDAINALVWKKDADKTYIFANPLHCNVFFDFTPEFGCLDYIKEKTDKDLIIEVFRDNHIQNTFGEICCMSDDYTEKIKKTAHYLEAGLVDGKDVLLYVIKTPQFDNENKFIGTIGMGWVVSGFSEIIITQLNSWIDKEQAVELHCEDNVFCYYLKPEIQRCSVFHHICPKAKGNLPPKK